MQACTIIARNYLAHARVLATSFLAHHPEARFTVLLLDGADGAYDAEPFVVLSPYEIGIEQAELHRMAMIYDVTELATAVKPWFLRTLLSSGADSATYFDPDIEVFAPLDHIPELARRHSIVLIPHTTRPLPRDRSEPSETTLLYSGIYNLGFISVGKGSAEFLDWWSDRLARECRLEPDAHRFVDQRWVDFAPGMFDHYILRDPGCDLAHWNLWGRSLEWTGERYDVDGVPLRFYHFSGFNPDEPHLLSRHQGPFPRVLLSERPALRRLCRDYANKLFQNGYRRVSSLPYGLDTLPNGVPIDKRMRRLYRAELLAAEGEGKALPPDPFDAASTDAFLAWLNEPVDAIGDARKVSRYLHTLRAERPDLQQAFPDLRWRDADAYLDWVVTAGRRQAQIPHELLPERGERAEADAAAALARPLEPGLNVSGFFRAELGIGEAARQLIGAIKLAGLPFSTVTYSARTSSRQQHPFEGAATTEPIYDTNLICVNADVLPHFANDMGPDYFRDRYSIGVWWWEVSQFPASMHRAFDYVHEIWVGSDYANQAISRATDKPVLTVPLAVEVPDVEPLSRSELGLPEGFLFLFSFDFFSVLERKNPLGLIEAFKRAFAPGDGPTLVLKSINGSMKLEELERVRAVADRPDILVVDKYVSSREKDSYMAVCDCYVSLHRSEGFGLTMAEAMGYGKPVIATGYSGNLAFMTEDNSYLVPYETSRVPSGCDPYPAGAEWAEPSLKDAAEVMRYVYEHPEDARERGLRARHAILTQRSAERSAEFIAERYRQIRALREPGGSAHELALAPVGAGQAPLERAATMIARGPAPVASSSRLGRPTVWLRRLLRRALWPYVADQHALSASLVEAVSGLHTVQAEHGETLARLEQGLRQRVDEVVDELERLDRSLRDLRLALDETSISRELAIGGSGAGEDAAAD